VGALAGSVLQGELIVSERNFTRMFPDVQGYRFFLIQGPPTAAGTLEDALSDFGFDAAPATERLAGFHRVENTYLSTFQALGALGLLLGTLGLAAVLLRNVLERRRELALMTALGYHENQLSRVVLAENGFLAGAGLLVGAFCAVVAIAPAAVERGAAAPFGALAALLAAVAATALVSSLAAVRVARRGRLIEALRAE
jgi:ABC-type antimicrobial peptide transport system permease subunit